jgi:molecular chaperone DnaK (HSP70)
MDIMIPRNTLIPVSEKRKYSNDTPNETSLIIKVFEGERKMTKDNFCVGEFELSGLTPSPRGYHDIEVTFIVDVDGMITVTAEDLHKNNLSKIRINGNRCRLSKESIDKMIISAQEFEKNDKICKRKKKMHYELIEMCENIDKNLDYKECQLPENEKEVIRMELVKIRTLLKKDPEDIDEITYKEQLFKIKRDYCILITKLSDDSQSIIQNVEYSTDTSGTSVFQTDEDEDKNKSYSKIVADELGYIDMDETELNEIKQIRDTLVEMCHNISDIINDMNTIVNEEMKMELKDYIEDLIVWIHVQPKISKNEYQEKIEELTQKCNKCINNDENITMVDGYTELKTLCDSIKNSISSNPLSICEKDINILNMEIDKIFVWMSENKCEIQEKYDEKIQYINQICNNIYTELIDIKK